jgi:hypothetical protein
MSRKLHCLLFLPVLVVAFTVDVSAPGSLSRREVHSG